MFKYIVFLYYLFINILESREGKMVTKKSLIFSAIGLAFLSTFSYAQEDVLTATSPSLASPTLAALTSQPRGSQQSGSASTPSGPQQSGSASTPSGGGSTGPSLSTPQQRMSNPPSGGVSTAPSNSAPTITQHSYGNGFGDRQMHTNPAPQHNMRHR